MDKSQVYLILGSPDSGRRSLVSDLIEFGLDPADSSKVLISPLESSDAIGSKGDISVAPYDWDGEKLSFPETGEGTDRVFVIADGRSVPTDFIEAFQGWLLSSGCELARVITVVDCSLAEKIEKMRVWLDCCIHFSDVAILSRRDGVSNKWIGAFQERYEKELCIPCLFELDRKGRVRNPALVLDPVPRRITRIFDEPDPYEFDDDEEDEEEEEILDEELAPGDLESDPYLKRNGSGRRDKTVPNIAQLLDELS